MESTSFRKVWLRASAVALCAGMVAPMAMGQPVVNDPTVTLSVYDTGGMLNPGMNGGMWLGGLEVDPAGGIVFASSHDAAPGGSSNFVALIGSTGLGTAFMDASGPQPFIQTTRASDLTYMGGAYWMAATDMTTFISGVYGITPGSPGFMTFAAGPAFPFWSTSGLTFNAAGNMALVTSDVGNNHHSIMMGAAVTTQLADASPPPIGYGGGADDHVVLLDGRTIVVTDFPRQLFDVSGGAGAVNLFFDLNTIAGFVNGGYHGSRGDVDPVSGDIFVAFANAGGTDIFRVKSDGSVGSIFASGFRGPGIRDLAFGPSSSGFGTSLYASEVATDPAGNVIGTIYEMSFNQPPVCGGGTVTIWPPNHKFYNIDVLAVSGAFDPDGDPITFQVTGITQDEMVNSNGDGNTSCDGMIMSNTVVKVRRERQGGGNGRVYNIHYTVTDPAGASCMGTIVVEVPHDDDGMAAVDDGQFYNSVTCMPAADVTGDGVVNFDDIVMVLGDWGMFGPDATLNWPDGDANFDGGVYFSDITAILGQWGMTSND